MKKIAALVLGLMLLGSLAACGGGAAHLGTLKQRAMHDSVMGPGQHAFGCVVVLAA